MATLGLSMIVRNAEKTVRRAVEPFRETIDEIVAVDTGSTDSTRQILTDLGARVLSFHWNDNFAAARNAALDAATTDWIFSLDSDEWVAPDVPAMAHALAQRPDIDSYFVETMNFLATKEDGTIATVGDDRHLAPAYTPSIKIRLTRLGPRWVGAVHELLDFDARRLGFRIALAPFRIRHDGMMQGGNSTYYVELCRKAYRTGEVHPGILFVLGLEAIRDDDNAGAERFWREAIAMENGFVKGYVGLARLLHLTARSGEAVALVQQGLRACALSAEIPQLLAFAIDLHAELGERDCMQVMINVAGRICPGDPLVAEAAARHSRR